MLKIDEATCSKSKMSFAQVVVEMNVEEGFLEEFFFIPMNLMKSYHNLCNMTGFQFGVPNVVNMAIMLGNVVWVNKSLQTHSFRWMRTVLDLLGRGLGSLLS